MDFIEAGRGRIALVVGAEKMTATPNAEVGDILLGASYRAEEADITGGFAGLFGQIAGNYFQRYGDRSEELAMIAAKNHANGVANPYAHMRKDLGFALLQHAISDRNPRVAGPLRRTDCSLVSDGAAYSSSPMPRPPPPCAAPSPSAPAARPTTSWRSPAATCSPSRARAAPGRRRSPPAA
jgi:acetyl-CoA C-acetyltransferase